MTWAIVHDQLIVGSIRLETHQTHGTAEIGIWLIRSSRGRRIGTKALADVMPIAFRAGFTTIVATTTSENQGAVRLLDSFSFTVTGTGDAVHASLDTFDGMPDYGAECAGPPRSEGAGRADLRRQDR